MEANNQPAPGPPVKVKGTWGGGRIGAGRPRKNPLSVAKTVKANTVRNLSSAVHPQLRAGGSRSSTTASLAPAAFFHPYNTHRPVPRSATVSAPSRRPSSWAAVGASHSEPISTGNSEGNTFVSPNTVGIPQLSSSDCLIEDISDSAESTAEAAEAETQSSQPKEHSVIHKYLQGLDPDKLCFPMVLVWLPHLLPGHPDRFKCTCGKPLSKNGFHDNPIARRVRDIPTDFFLLTNYYICDSRKVNDPGCGTSHCGIDPHIIEQLPRFVQAAFPSYISARGAISRLMMQQMANTFASRFGPAPFSELISEIQHRHHADSELMYLGAADFYRRLGFLKYMGGVKGEDIFTAAYTVGNEFEEIQAHALTLNKSLSFLKDMFEGIRQGLKNSENAPTQVMYTDSPQSERSFHEDMNSSLLKDVQTVTDWTDLPPFECTLDIPTAVISDSMAIEEITHDVLADLIPAASSPQFHPTALAIKRENCAGKPAPLDIIQIRTKDKNFVMKVTALTSRSHILPSLISILTNPHIIKIGHSIHQTLQTISDTLSLPEIGTMLKSKNAPILDLGKYAKLKGVVDNPSISLHALAGVVLQKSFLIPDFSRYPWAAPTSAQSEFLFKEIECQWQISLSLHHRDSIGLPLQPTQAITDGQPVTLVQGCKPIAEGTIIGTHSGYLNAAMDDQGHTLRINVSATRSLIQISKVLVPGAIHALHKQTMEWIFAHGKQAVVTTSQLHTRSKTPPLPSDSLARAFAIPVPPSLSQADPEFALTYSPGQPSNSNIMGNESDDDLESPDDDLDFEGMQPAAPVPMNPDPIDGINDDLFGPEITENSSADVIMESIEHTFNLLNNAAQSEKLPTLHTHKEYTTFKANINHPNFRKSGKVSAPHEHWKNIDFDKFAQFWNMLVNSQSRTITDSNQRLYYKLPIKLETHHKKVLSWNSELSTLTNGTNFAAHKALLEILNSSDNHVDVLPALPLPDSMPDGEVDLSIAGSLDPRSFNPMAMLPAQGELGDSELIQHDHSGESSSTQLTFHNMIQPSGQEDTYMSVSTVTESTPGRPSGVQELKVQCRSLCSAGEKVRISEDTIIAYLEAQQRNRAAQAKNLAKCVNPSCKCCQRKEDCTLCLLKKSVLGLGSHVPEERVQGPSEVRKWCAAHWMSSHSPVLAFGHAPVAETH
ncbi:hypothetical protein DFH07DRAFT_778935 [Mycena maculata]|uniref:3'-5' exonuclease domain-containing protein n=1 Tax=Mycena maculata TaxID=230809 RepID=A0AAD7MZD9_9AGAR|nr:hypothetical protein DFH07DRAFT_778935 [Mycena maculata]